LTTVLLPAAVSSGDLIIDRRYRWAHEGLDAGDLLGAIDLAEQIVVRAPAFAPAWFLLGEVRELAGAAAGAAAAFERARAADPADSLAPRCGWPASAPCRLRPCRLAMYARYSTRMRRISTTR
jgi:hypothetical protein